MNSLKKAVSAPDERRTFRVFKNRSETVSDILKLMTTEGSLVRINDSLYITSSSYRNMIGSLKTFFSKKPEMTVAEFRDVLSTTRKYALPFLEYLDSNKVTLRVGDIRKLLKD
jgi:selenocysteine-specific elongation factor